MPLRINTRQLTTLMGQAGLTRLALVALITWTALAIGLLSIWTSRHVLTDSTAYSTKPQSSPELQRPALDINLLAAARFFGKPPRKPESVIAPPQAIVDSQWLLQGIFTGDSPSTGSAIIVSGDQPAALYHTHQYLPGGAKLLEVHTNHVVLEQHDKRKTLRFPSVAPVPTTLGTAPAIASRINAPQEVTDERRKIVRQRLEKLRQRALSRS